MRSYIENLPKAGENYNEARRLLTVAVRNLDADPGSVVSEARSVRRRVETVRVLCTTEAFLWCPSWVTLPPGRLKNTKELSTTTLGLQIHSSKLTWKCSGAPKTTGILYIGPPLSFHVNLGEGSAKYRSCFCTSQPLMNLT